MEKRTYVTPPGLELRPFVVQPIVNIKSDEVWGCGGVAPFSLVSRPPTFPSRGDNGVPQESPILLADCLLAEWEMVSTRNGMWALSAPCPPDTGATEALSGGYMNSDEGCSLVGRGAVQ
jgi:hypothetical protein